MGRTIEMIVRGSRSLLDSVGGGADASVRPVVDELFFADPDVESVICSRGVISRRALPRHRWTTLAPPASPPGRSRSRGS
jgi:hypothetical protein